jgi:hypothetical protein
MPMASVRARSLRTYNKKAYLAALVTVPLKKVYFLIAKIPFPQKFL